MLNYTVYEPPVPAQDLDARAEALVFVKEGFSPAAFFLGPLWLAGQRAWLALVACLVGLALLIGLFLLIPGGNGALGIVLVLAAYLFALEADSLRRWTLERRGYRLIGTVSGKSLPECEQRFLSGWIGGLRAVAKASLPHVPAARELPGTMPDASLSVVPRI